MAPIKFEKDEPGRWASRAEGYSMRLVPARVGSTWVLHLGDEAVAWALEFIETRPLTDQERAAYPGLLDPNLYRVRLEGNEALAQKRVGPWTCREIYQAFYETYLNSSPVNFPHKLCEVSFDRDVMRDACDRAGV